MHLHHRRSFIQQMQAGRKLRFETAWSRLNLHYLESETPLIVQLVARQTGVIHSIGLSHEDVCKLVDFLQHCLESAAQQNT